MNDKAAVHLHRDGAIAVITIDNPPVNTIDAGVRRDLGRRLDDLEGLGDVDAVLLRSAGKTFCSGADIGEFHGPPKEAEYRELFYRLENLPVPVVAAVHGMVLGGGLELALACHYRVAAPGTRCGLPEITFGIIPGAGGTQRMPRLIGVEQTLELILSARPVPAEQGVQLGFIDAMLDGDLERAALEYTRELVRNGASPRPTAAMDVDPATATPAIVERLTADAQRLYPNQQAPQTAIRAVAAAAELPLADGLLLEDRLVNEAKLTTESRAAIHVFFAERESRRVPGLANVAARPIAHAAIIGAGTMGGGIAICFANAGIPVTVLDISAEALDRGLGVVGKTLESRVKRGRMSAEEKEQRLALIGGTTDYGGLADADIFIEAAVEKMELKKGIFRRLDELAKPGAILATNTSTLDIDELATATRRPEDVIGMHFFSPANVMPLLEVVRTKSTSPETIKTVMELAKPLRKTPVLAGVCYGFIGNRMMEGYAREAERMVLEGATPREVDTALEGWGMAMGILSVFDMAGVDVGVHVHRDNAHLYPPDPTYYQADFALFDAGRLGQKTGRGYYRYEPGDRTRHDDPEALEILRAKARDLGVETREHSAEEIVERCLYPLMNEGFRILEEGIALRASDIDVVWTSGYGFPRFRGGPMFHAGTIGLETLLEGMRKYAVIFGPMHWQPANLLVELVEKGQTLSGWEQERGVSL
ncbi:MAG TPA: 3-hydroxyacyl-CoA dehydrogenase NAD-binding domain-containing protein [Woeseiaceae bacterium]|nr:3-hydroxyacyl-CoA dehydrogenase NAD-binding domain-containing protein [Woeseiaceae bacterium]